MGIISLNTNTTGLVGDQVNPRRITMVTTDSLATITTAGYLNSAASEGFIFLPTDVLEALYDFNTSTQAGTLGFFQLSFSGRTITLNAWENPGNVLLPVVDGHFANFNGTSGQIKDDGFLPSDATKTNVVMASAAVIANHIACFSDTAGTVNDDAATAINGGNIQAGLSGTAGTLASFPATAANGSLILAATNAGGAFNTTISNSTMGQSSVISIPDPAAATGNFAVAAAALVNGNLIQASGTAGLIADAGVAPAAIQLSANIKAAQTADIGGGGAGPINIVVAGLTAASVVTATILSSTNTVAVAKCAPGAGSFDITFTGDPGAACVVNYVAFIAAQ